MLYYNDIINIKKHILNALTLLQSDFCETNDDIKNHLSISLNFLNKVIFLDKINKKVNNMKKISAGKKKIKKVMKEFKKGELHSGTKKGPTVTSRKQAVAIALSEARKLPGKKSKYLSRRNKK